MPGAVRRERREGGAGRAGGRRSQPSARRTCLAGARATVRRANVERRDGLPVGRPEECEDTAVEQRPHFARGWVDGPERPGRDRRRRIRGRVWRDEGEGGRCRVERECGGPTDRDLLTARPIARLDHQLVAVRGIVARGGDVGPRRTAAADRRGAEQTGQDVRVFEGVALEVHLAEERLRAGAPRVEDESRGVDEVPVERGGRPDDLGRGTRVGRRDAQRDVVRVRLAREERHVAAVRGPVQVEGRALVALVDRRGSGRRQPDRRRTRRRSRRRRIVRSRQPASRRATRPGTGSA